MCFENVRKTFETVRKEPSQIISESFHRIHETQEQPEKESKDKTSESTQFKFRTTLPKTYVTADFKLSLISTIFVKNMFLYFFQTITLCI